MRLIDADALEAVMRVAINGMKLTAKLFGISGDDEVSATLKAYEDILDGIKEQPTVEADDGWIPCSDHQPKLNKYVLFSTKKWPYPTPDEDNRVFKGMRLKERRSGKIMWFSYGPGHIDDEDVLAWREMPRPYEPKEGV